MAGIGMAGIWCINCNRNNLDKIGSITHPRGNSEDDIEEYQFICEHCGEVFSKFYSIGQGFIECKCGIKSNSECLIHGKRG